MDKQDIVKNQHYVPAFYLKSFVNSSGEVEIFDCEKRKILAPKGPKGICSEEFYYGVKTGQADEVSQKVEEYFKLLENNLAPQFRVVIDKILNYEQILPQDKYAIAFLMSMIWIRGPEMRTRITEMAADMIKQVTQLTFSMKPGLLDEIDKKVGWEESDEEARIYCREAVLKGDLDVVVDNSQHMRMFASIENFGNLFYGQDWVVYISKNEKTFITTDNPVAMHIPKIHGFYGPTFLERTHYFSLTPNIFIIARPPHTLDGKKFHRKTLYSKNWMQIMDLNYTIGGYAYQYAYSCDKKSFEDILKALALEEKLAEFQLRQKIKNRMAQSSSS